MIYFSTLLLCSAAMSEHWHQGTPFTARHTSRLRVVLDTACSTTSTSLDCGWLRSVHFWLAYHSDRCYKYKHEHKPCASSKLALESSSTH